MSLSTTASRARAGAGLHARTLLARMDALTAAIDRIVRPELLPAPPLTLGLAGIVAGAALLLIGFGAPWWAAATDVAGSLVVAGGLVLVAAQRGGPRFRRRAALALVSGAVALLVSPGEMAIPAPRPSLLAFELLIVRSLLDLGAVAALAWALQSWAEDTRSASLAALWERVCLVVAGGWVGPVALVGVLTPVVPGLRALFAAGGDPGIVSTLLLAGAIALLSLGVGTYLVWSLVTTAAIAATRRSRRGRRVTPQRVRIRS